MGTLFNLQWTEVRESSAPPSARPPARHSFAFLRYFHPVLIVAMLNPQRNVKATLHQKQKKRPVFFCQRGTESLPKPNPVVKNAYRTLTLTLTLTLGLEP